MRSGRGATRLGRRARLALVLVATFANVGAMPASANPTAHARIAPAAPAITMPFAGASAADDAGRAASKSPQIVRFLEAVLPILGVICFMVFAGGIVYWILEEQRKK